MPQAPLKGPRKYPREYLSPLPGHRYLTRVGSSQLPLKGTASPFGSNDRLRASPRMYPRELRGPPRGLSFTAAPQGRWATDAASALPPPLHFPFGSLQGWVGAGRASPSGLGSPSLSSPSALSRGWRCPRESLARDGADPSLRTFVRPALSGSWAAPEGMRAGAPRRGDVVRRPGVGPPPALEPWSPAEVAARLALVPGLTDVREGKGPRS